MFELKKSGDQYHFVLKAANGQVILSSQMYASKASAMNGIESVKKNSGNDGMYEKKTAKNGKFHFNLKSSNGQIVGSSQMYAAESGMNNGIESVKKNAPGADVTEVE
ncbi:MAG TPA: YegP family protein [Flavobacteriaceae bacterium]|nr:YegP family protein [Flavobacteriaceae bacterium]MCB9213442.1 YegP family protein [Alteromonas sp.]HPF12507.1 YegP family protein [Flavobacteriaceae bacterium]HQU22368.1 YegP family protein [Flavobacteriaceae bacterium]HQU66305.1 YegP family protein [Flavobacteriaceae bacterium]